MTETTQVDIKRVIMDEGNQLFIALDGLPLEEIIRTMRGEIASLQTDVAQLKEARAGAVAVSGVG